MNNEWRDIWILDEELYTVWKTWMDLKIRLPEFEYRMRDEKCNWPTTAMVKQKFGEKKIYLNLLTSEIIILFSNIV